jgi:predicted RNase H-like nuclease
MRHGKKTRAGLDERLTVLGRYFLTAHKLFAAARAGHPKSQLADDDIVDAMGLAVVAAMDDEHLRRVPEIAEFDATGLPMEIVFLGWNGLTLRPDACRVGFRPPWVAMLLY